MRIETNANLVQSSVNESERFHKMPSSTAVQKVISFLLDSPLYAEFTLTEIEQYAVLYNKRSRDIRVDTHCPFCHREATFHFKGKNLFSNAEWDAIAGRNTFDEASFTCARQPSHRIHSFFLINKGTLTKTGQYPSLADVANDESKAYKSVLDRQDAAELHRAIGLAAHGIGIGSFVYLRRVFERLIQKRFDEFAEVENWSAEDFRKLRFQDRIELMKDHLPNFMVVNKKIYSILSVGIHNLSDEQCLAAFDFLKSSITLILDEDKRKKEEIAIRKKLSDAIAGFKYDGTADASDEQD